MMKPLLFVVLGSCAALLSLEGVLQLLPTPTATHMGYHIDPMIVTYAPHHQFVESYGWTLSDAHRPRANNFGFLTSREFAWNDAAIAVVGDSYVDGSFLDEQERFGAQVQAAIGPARPVFALGSPGSSLLDYAERVRFAAEHFGIRDFVLLAERGDVRQTLCGSGNVQGPCIDPVTLQRRVEPIEFPSSVVRDLVRHSALAEYLSQIRFTPSAIAQIVIDGYSPKRAPAALAAPAAPALTPGTVPRPAVDAILDAFFAAIAPYRKGRFVIVFDCDHGALNRGLPASDPVRERFIARAREQGVTVIDTEPLFREYLAHSRLHLEISPGNMHWNREANRIVAAALAPSFAD